jgi:hypothetical protein
MALVGAAALPVVVASLGLAAPAQAGPAMDLASLAHRGLTKTLTDYDRAYLMARPKLAALVPDETQTVLGQSVGPKEAVASGSEAVTALTTTYCAATDRYQIHKSLLGAIIFRYHTYGHWCWTGTNVRVDTHYPYFDMIQTVVVNKGVTANELRNANPTWTIHTQNYVQLCTLGKSLGSVCYANIYPTNWVTVSNKSGSTFRSSI